MRSGGAVSTLVTGATVSVLDGMVGGLGLTRFGRGEVGADIAL